MTKWSALTNDESLIDSTTEAVDLQNGASNQRIRFSIPTLGQSVIPVHKISDLPPVINTARTAEQDKSYLFLEGLPSFSEPILLPAGWNGAILGIPNSLTEINYSGSGALFRTLNINNAILILDAGGGAILCDTGTAHGLLNGQFVNITGTTSYNQQRLVISNVSSVSFDVQLPFVGNEAGFFNTGLDSITISNIKVTNLDTASLLDIGGATDILSKFKYSNLQIDGFTNVGTIKNTKSVIGDNGNFSVTTSGLLLKEVENTILSTTTFGNTTNTAGVSLLTFLGGLTRNVALRSLEFNLFDSSQFAMNIEPAAGSADRISITNCPDNNVATNYFNPSGLDQTDDAVFTFNNGVRANSMTDSESRSVGVLEVDGSGGVGVAVPIVDLTPAAGDFELDSASEGFSMDTSTGVVTYDGNAPRTVIIGYSLEAAQASGANQNLTFDLRINNIQQSKTIRTLITMGTGTFLPVSTIGGFFIINPSDTFQLFKNNVGNANNTDIQNVTLLIR